MATSAAKHDHLYVGVDVGGTKILSALVTESGAVLARRRLDTPREGGNAAAMTAIRRSIDDLLSAQSLATDELTAIGIAVPGVVDPKAGRVALTPNMGLSDAPLKIHRILIVKFLARGSSFTFIPRCMHWRLFGPLLRQLMEEFDDAEFVTTETNSDNYELYPDNVAVIPYSATRYIASELAVHLKYKLDMSGCVRMIVPVMNPKGEGYEEFFSFARDANIPEVLIAEADGKIRKAPR